MEITRTSNRRENKWGIALSRPRYRGNRKWGIIFLGNPNEKPEINSENIWEAAKND